MEPQHNFIHRLVKLHMAITSQQGCRLSLDSMEGHENFLGGGGS